MSHFQQQLLLQAVEAAGSLSSTTTTSTNYVACHLYRPDWIQPQAWGLWISFHRNAQGERTLVIGGVRPDTFASVLQWARVTSSVPENAILTNQAYGWNVWKSYFALLPEASSAASRTLEAGDTILSLNGIPAYAFGDSIANVMEYLKRCNQLFLVAARNTTRTTRLDPNLQRIIKTVTQQAAAQRTILPTMASPSPQRTDSASNTSRTPVQTLPHNMLRIVTPSQSEPQAPATTTTSSLMHYPSPKHSKPLKVYKATCATHPPAAQRHLIILPTIIVKNSMFSIPYSDNQYTHDPDEGAREQDFIVRVDRLNFHHWLRTRKRKWRSTWNIQAQVVTSKAADILASCSMHYWSNPMFTVVNGEDGPKAIPFCDNVTFDPYDGSRSQQFLVRIDASNFSSWLADRKQKWRATWKPYAIEGEEDELMDVDHNNMNERNESSVPYEFWTNQEYSSFEEWLTASKQKWKKSYSWNSNKRKRIQQVCEEIVQFPSSRDPLLAQQELLSWLRVRKNQWKMLRRKRHRRWEEEKEKVSRDVILAHATSPHAHIASGDYEAIDELLEEEELKNKTLEERKKHRQPEEISFLFLPSLGLSDDVAALCLQFLDCSEHGKLLCISKVFSEGLQSRAYMWQLLCNRCPHWHLPRRPRKPWYKLYLSKLRTEVFASQKQWDDLLTNVSEVLLKGDQLRVVKKLIESAEKKFSFTVDYVSGVVCERNSILNLAVIHKRHKVVRWLVEEKNADLETSDRGHFTPLLNAAWGGDKPLVRFLLHHGADRSKIGTGHYTEALAPSDFRGLTAEGWARKKGHHDIAELIRVGL